MSAEVTPEQLAEDAGWQALRKSALMAPTATIVSALCNYAERRTTALLNEVERLATERDELFNKAGVTNGA